MNSKIIVATIAGGVAYFLLGWLIYGILLMDFYTANTIQYAGLWKEMPNLLLMFLSNLLGAFLLAFIFHRWAGISTFSGGLTGGLILGLILALMWDLYFLSSMNLYSVTLVVVDVIVSTIFTGIIGGLIGWILGFGKKEEAMA